MLLSYLIKLGFWSGVSYWIAGYWSWWWPILYTSYAVNYMIGNFNGRSWQMTHDQHIVEALTSEVNDLRIRLFKAEAERDESREKLRVPRVVSRRLN